MSPMTAMMVLFGVLAFVFVILVIYRSTLVMHEDDQLFIGSSESHMAKEQEELQVKLGKIEPMVNWVGAASVAVLLMMAGLWLYGGLNRTIE